MDNVSDRLIEALSKLEAVADAVTPDEAPAQLDESAVQLFWREWPRLGSWAGAVWRRLNEDFADPATAPGDSELDEIGGESG